MAMAEIDWLRWRRCIYRAHDNDRVVIFERRWAEEVGRGGCDGGAL